MHGSPGFGNAAGEPAHGIGPYPAPLPMSPMPGPSVLMPYPAGNGPVSARLDGPSTVGAVVGAAEEPNYRFNAENQDAYIVVDPLAPNLANYALFGVYDGHGGLEAVRFVSNTLHETIAEMLLHHGGKTNEVSVSRALREAFLAADSRMLMRGSAVALCGACVTVILIIHVEGDRLMYTANVGDSRAVLARKAAVERITYDHKATDPAEMDLVAAKGGSIVDERVNGIIAISRVLGDHQLKHVLSAEPYVSELQLTDEDEFVIAASDGLWDVVDDDDAVRLAREAMVGNNDPSIAASALVTEAVRRGSQDNTTVVVIRLDGTVVDLTAGLETGSAPGTPTSQRR